MIIWLTIGIQTHRNQLAHVQKGCLARLRQDVRSDGSRIEGSHKGWNSLQRSFASGIELITALAHDFVLRRNCRTAFASKHPSAFTLSSHGSHHVRLVNYIAGLWNALLAKEKGKGSGKDILEELPGLPDVHSGEQFGLVSSDYTSSFKGLLEIKEEYKEDDEFDLSSFDDSSLAQILNIQKPALPKLPHYISSTSNVGAHDDDCTPIMDNTATDPPMQSFPGSTMVHDTAEATELNTTSVQNKRKSIHLDGICHSSDKVASAKRPRLYNIQSSNVAVSLPVLIVYFSNRTHLFF